MSIQDESFPYDYELDLSRNSGKLMVFPNNRAKSNKLETVNRLTQENERQLQDMHQKEGLQEDSTSDRDNSTESSNSCPPESETSRKTNASEPTENEVKKSEFNRKSHHNKSISYQDIHSEYTKRRYKHVESKVGQYIANIKALDEKRRSLNKFHRSMPETLSGPGVGASLANLSRTPSKGGILCRSANDLDQMREQDSQSDHEAENYDNLTATTSSSSRDGGILLDKQTYEQLLNAKERYEYVQTQLQEKNADYWRLKQNLETMRVEYTLCKEKLKQLNQTHRLSGSFGPSSLNALGKLSLNSLLYPPESSMEKATQTEIILTPSPVPLFPGGNEMYATPLTPESNNTSFDHTAVGVLAPAALKVHKTIATIQPLSLNFSNLLDPDRSRESIGNNTMGFFRHRSNSMAARKKSTPLAVPPANTSNADSSNNSSSATSGPSGDSAIDIEAIESPQNQRQKTIEEYHPMEEQSQRYDATETRNGGRSYTETEINFSAGTSLSAAAEEYRVRQNRNRKKLRNRIRRFFGACTKCEDANVSMDTMGNSQQQQSFSQIPLLEKSSTNPSQKSR